MNFLKKSTFTLCALLFSIAALTSCKDEDEPQIPTGNIRASVTFTPTQDTSTCWRRYMGQDLMVELVNKDNDEVLRINYTSEKANLDYGQYPYGNYQIRVIGYVREGNICTAADEAHSKIDTTQVFTLDGPTKSVTFKLTNK